MVARGVARSRRPCTSRRGSQRPVTPRLAGVAGYEGTICQDRSSECLTRVIVYLDRLRELTSTLIGTGAASDGADRMVLSAGGSAFFDVVVDHLRGPWPSGADVRVVLRSGCYLTHDSGMYERLSPLPSRDGARGFQPAMELWAHVLSRPEPELALFGFGKRDVPFDIDLPMPVAIRRAVGRSRGRERRPGDHVAQRSARVRSRSGGPRARARRRGGVRHQPPVHRVRQVAVHPGARRRRPGRRRDRHLLRGLPRPSVTGCVPYDGLHVRAPKGHRRARIAGAARGLVERRVRAWRRGSHLDRVVEERCAPWGRHAGRRGGTCRRGPGGEHRHRVRCRDRLRDDGNGRNVLYRHTNRLRRSSCMPRPWASTARRSRWASRPLVTLTSGAVRLFDDPHGPRNVQAGATGAPRHGRAATSWRRRGDEAGDHGRERPVQGDAHRASGRQLPGTRGVGRSRSAAGTGRDGAVRHTAAGSRVGRARHLRLAPRAPARAAPLPPGRRRRRLRLPDRGRGDGVPAG